MITLLAIHRCSCQKRPCYVGIALLMHFSPTFLVAMSWLRDRSLSLLINKCVVLIDHNVCILLRISFKWLCFKVYTVEVTSQNNSICCVFFTKIWISDLNSFIFHPMCISVSIRWQNEWISFNPLQSRYICIIMCTMSLSTTLIVLAIDNTNTFDNTNTYFVNF